MHDIWNAWHGCVKCSESCENSYMYYIDAMRDKDGGEIERVLCGGENYDGRRPCHFDWVKSLREEFGAEDDPYGNGMLVYKKEL